MSAPLSGARYEVLRALALGLELRGTPAGGSFVGPFQEPPHSAVSAAVMADLFAAGFVSSGEDSRVEITEAGRCVLRDTTEVMIRDAFRWLRSRPDLPGNTS